jgi:hypothetical protein
MHRKTVHRWIAALALIAALGVMGARPAAAADLSDPGIGDRLAGLWSTVSAGPAALWDSLVGWFGGGGMEKSGLSGGTDDGPNVNGTWGADPNGLPIGED